MRQQTLGPQKTSDRSKLPKNKTIMQHPSSQMKTTLQKQTSQRQYNFSNTQTKHNPSSKPKAKSGVQNKPKATKQQTSKLRPKKSKPRNYRLGQSKPNHLSFSQKRSRQLQNNAKVTAHKLSSTFKPHSGKISKKLPKESKSPTSTIIQKNRSQIKPSSFLSGQQQAKPQISGQQKISSQPKLQNTAIKQQRQVKNLIKEQNDQRKHHSNATDIKKTRHSKLKSKANGQKRLVIAKPEPHSYDQPNSHQKSPVPQSSQQMQSPRNSTAHQKFKGTKSHQSKTAKN